MHDITIKQAEPGTTLYDDQVKGLQLRAFKDRKSFYLYFRTKLKVERRPKIGDYPTITLAKARELARAMLNTVAEGKDPVVEREKARQAPTMVELWTAYYRDEASKNKSHLEDQRRWKLYLEPKLAKKRVADVDLDDLAKIHAGLKAKPYMANRVLALASTMLNYAEGPRCKYRPVGSNPCKHIERYPEPKRKRYMAGDEPVRIAEILKRESVQFPASVAFIYVLIMSGARKDEVGTAKLEWLDGSVLRLPDSKTGARSVYLPQQVMDVLATLPPGRKTLTGIRSPRKFWERIRIEAGCPDLRLHDLRHTFASAALKAGLSLAQIGELLGHASTQTTKRYAHLMEEAAHASVAKTADVMESMMAKKETA
jgi:integrase